MTPTSSKALPLLAAAALLAAVPATAVGESAAAAQYGLYHQAIEAARVCRELHFGQPEEAAMGAVISTRIGHQLGTERLPLLSDAQREAREIIETGGCDSTEVAVLLDLFDRELAPALE